MTSQGLLPAVTLPVRDREHKWDRDHEKHIAACDSIDGNERTERECQHCGMWKITVHPPHGLPWREWRTKNGDRWWGQATPPCLDEPKGTSEQDGTVAPSGPASESPSSSQSELCPLSQLSTGSKPR